MNRERERERERERDGQYVSMSHRQSECVCVCLPLDSLTTGLRGDLILSIAFNNASFSCVANRSNACNTVNASI